MSIHRVMYCVYRYVSFKWLYRARMCFGTFNVCFMCGCEVWVVRVGCMGESVWCRCIGDCWW